MADIFRRPFFSGENNMTGAKYSQQVPFLVSPCLANMRLLKFVFMGVSESSVADPSPVKPVE
jgi:hypothetical protein